MEIIFLVWLSFATPNIVVRVEEFKAACMHRGGLVGAYPGPLRQIILPSNGSLAKFQLAGLEIICTVQKTSVRDKK